MENNEARALNGHMKNVSKHLDNLVQEFRAFSKNVKDTSSKCLVSGSKEVTSNVVVEMDAVSPNIEGTATIFSSEEDVTFEIVFTGEMASRMKELLDTDVIEGLLLSSVVPE